MREYNFVISYDVADTKRLRKVAKILEKEALRFQYSVFLLYNYTEAELKLLLEKLLDIIDEKDDDLRVYKINNFGITLGNAIDLNNPTYIL
jgi:CRISPR-associated protein Cas2